MAVVQRFREEVTSDASGDVTAYTPSVSGLVRAISYTPHASTPLDTGADVTITGTVSGIPIITITNVGTSAVTVPPRAATVSTANAAALYAASGQGVNDLIPVADEAIKIVVAQGGNAKIGPFDIFVEGSQ